MKCCISGENFIRLLFLSAKLFKLEIQKCGQILCAHKPYFLMPGMRKPGLCTQNAPLRIMAHISFTV